jgi:nucleoside-diphosphate-sugar epimerase
MSEIKTIFVTGAGGYVGSVLVPKLLDSGFRVRAHDLFIYGEHVLNAVKDHANLEIIRGDLRDKELLEKTLPGSDAVIHLACISNDPSFELNPDLGKSINYDAFIDLVAVAKFNGVKRFIYASSSSVYGIKTEAEVTEDLSRQPLTDYSKYKAMCEDVLMDEREKGFTTLILRPATVCGYSPRLRLDLTVNILTNHAINNNKITVFGGGQMRPNIHIEDMTDLYVQSLQLDDILIDGKVYNAGYENYEVREIAQMVRNIVGEQVDIATVPTDDNRSYRVSSHKIAKELSFTPRHSIEKAVSDLSDAFNAGKILNSMNNPDYFNIDKMKKLNLR